MARDSRISIKITADMKQELEQLAASYGLTISSLGAYIIGQFIHETNNKINNKERLAGATAVNHCPGGSM